MAKYNFRIRVLKARGSTLDIDQPNKYYTFTSPDINVKVSSTYTKTTIKKSDRLSFIGSDFATKKDAQMVGENFLNALMITFARLRVGVDFGARAPKSHITEYGLKFFEQKFKKNLINDVHGLMVYEPEPSLEFASYNMKLVLGRSESSFEEVWRKSLTKQIELTEKERIAFDLFNLSFFQNNEESRFILLIMAIESLIKQKKRNENEINYIDKIIEQTENEESLENGEKESFINAFGSLKSESISKAGRKLVEKKLGHKKYKNLSAVKFFSECYQIRSKLVHGTSSLPTREEVAQYAGELEVFVSDLLTDSFIKN
jgi:CII-binding regulator of phage lambda lysogenization HflD